MDNSVIVAQREFILSPRRKRCLCLWMCSCFCFDYFLSTEAKDLCHTMSPENEIYAGFLDDKNYDEIENEIEIGKNLLILIPLMIVFIVLLLGK